MSSQLPEPYRIKPVPAVYKGISMRSMLEVDTARALDRIGIKDWRYEETRFADEEGQYTPDFKIPAVYVKGWGRFDVTAVYVEARPTMLNQGFRKKAELNAATLALSTDDPLLFVGLEEMPAALLGWCYGINRHNPVLGVIGLWRNVTIDGQMSTPQPCLYVDTAAAVWLDGWHAGHGGPNGLDYR